MLFLLPILGIKAAVATITVGQAIGFGTMALGIGAGIKGAVDYNNAKKLMAEAEREYEAVAQKMRKHSAHLKKSSERLAV